MRRPTKWEERGGGQVKFNPYKRTETVLAMLKGRDGWGGGGTECSEVVIM